MAIVERKEKYCYSIFLEHHTTNSSEFNLKERFGTPGIDVQQFLDSQRFVNLLL